MVDRAFDDGEVAAVVGVAERPPGDLVQVVDVAVGVDDHDQLGQDIMWAPQMACITFWACLGYFLSIETIAQLWKPPASGRW